MFPIKRRGNTISYRQSRLPEDTKLNALLKKRLLSNKCERFYWLKIDITVIVHKILRITIN